VERRFHCRIRDIIKARPSLMLPYRWLYLTTASLQNRSNRHSAAQTTVQHREKIYKFLKLHLLWRQHKIKSKNVKLAYILHSKGSVLRENIFHCSKNLIEHCFWPKNARQLLALCGFSALGTLWSKQQLRLLNAGVLLLCKAFSKWKLVQH